MSLPTAAAPVCFILTADRAKSKPFYADVLGLRLLGEDAHAITFDLGNRTPMRLSDVPGHRGSGHPVVGWNVANIVETVRQLAAKGVKFEVYEGYGQDADGIWHSPDGGAKVAWFTDPDGNLLSLTQFG